MYHSHTLTVQFREQNSSHLKGVQKAETVGFYLRGRRKDNY